MTDREKVMQWLEACVSGCEEGCPYEYENLAYREECKADLMRDALALLKEQPEIIRCKDCKHYDSETQSCNNGLGRVTMLDREKVVSKLDDLRQFADTEIHPIVSPDNWDVYSKLCDLIDMTKDDVLALLKEQEPVEPILKREGWIKYCNYYVCPCCDEEVDYDQNYCSECGAKFMWEGR